MQPEPFNPKKSLVNLKEIKPPAPLAKLYSITRGAPNGNDSCSDTGVITITIPATSMSENLIYSFELESGRADDLIFYEGTYTAGYKDKAFLYFIFPWLDGANARQESLNLKVRITAHTKSGLKGESVLLNITDPGR